MNLGIIFAWIVEITLKWVPSAFYFFNKGLETTKNATDAISSVKNLLPEPKDDETSPEDIAERIYAVSSLTRSYALFGFLELLLWIWKGIILYVFLTKSHELLTRSTKDNK